MIKQEKSYLPRENFFENKSKKNTIINEIKRSKEKIALEESLSMKNYVNNVVIPEVKFFSSVGIRKRRFKINENWSNLNISRIEDLLSVHSIKADVIEIEGDTYLYTSIYPEENAMFTWNSFEGQIYDLIESIIHNNVKEHIINASLNNLNELTLSIPENFRNIYYISIISNIFNKNSIEVSYDLKNNFEEVKLSWNEHANEIKTTTIENIFDGVINFDIKKKVKEIENEVEFIVFEGFRKMKDVRLKLDELLSKLESNYNYTDLYMGSIASTDVVIRNVEILLDIISAVKIEYANIVKKIIALSHKHMFKDDLYSLVLELSEFQKNYELSDVAKTYLKEIDNIFKYCFKSIQKVKSSVTKMVLIYKDKKADFMINPGVVENINILLELPEKLDLKSLDIVNKKDIELFYQPFDIEFYNDLLSKIELNKIDYDSNSINIAVKEDIEEYFESNNSNNNYNENKSKYKYSDYLNPYEQTCEIEERGNRRLKDNRNDEIYENINVNYNGEPVKKEVSLKALDLDANTMKYYGYLATFFITIVLIVMLLV